MRYRATDQVVTASVSTLCRSPQRRVCWNDSPHNIIRVRLSNFLPTRSIRYHPILCLVMLRPVFVKRYLDHITTISIPATQLPPGRNEFARHTIVFLIIKKSSKLGYSIYRWAVEFQCCVVRCWSISGSAMNVRFAGCIRSVFEVGLRSAMGRLWRKPSELRGEMLQTI